MLNALSLQMRKDFIKEIAKYTYKPGYILSPVFLENVNIYGIRLKVQRTGPKGESQLFAIDRHFSEDELLLAFQEKLLLGLKFLPL